MEAARRELRRCDAEADQAATRARRRAERAEAAAKRAVEAQREADQARAEAEEAAGEAEAARRAAAEAADTLAAAEAALPVVTRGTAESQRTRHSPLAAEFPGGGSEDTVRRGGCVSPTHHIIGTSGPDLETRDYLPGSFGAGGQRHTTITPTPLAPGPPKVFEK